MSGKARKTYDPRGRMLSARRPGNAHKVHNMTENPPDENTEAPKAPDIQGALEGLRKANEALLAKLQEMEKKNSELDAKITAMSGRQAEAAPPQPVKTDLDIAYEKALAELGIKKKD